MLLSGKALSLTKMMKKSRKEKGSVMSSSDPLRTRKFLLLFSQQTMHLHHGASLDELVKIMECQKMKDHIAYPVFYDVEPTKIRNQTGAVGEAFAKHVNAEAARKWRDALTEATNLAGRELKNTFDGHEAKFVQKIVQEIAPELRSINSSFDEKLVGMEERVKYVVSSLETDIDDVRFIGIKGMGGAGKTTLARAVYDKILHLFEGSSFVENVRECSKDSSGGLKSLQKQILSDVLEKQDIKVSGVYEGKKMMQQRIRGIKVLIVLDDVNHIEQLEALAGDLNWFKPGSQIIITTRDEQVLVAHRVPKKFILNVYLLFEKEAICLFSRYAFGTEMPIQGYEKLSEQFVRYANGLPLTIRVLGSDLCGKDKLDWIDKLERLRTIPLNETLQKLELSYNSLEEDHKKIFLEVACMLKGWMKEDEIIALESCNYHARDGLRVLEQKSLITLSSGCLGMHDHIEEMGQNIVRRWHPEEPYKHSRLWIEKEVRDILVEDKGTEATRCIKVRKVGLVDVMNGLRKMKELRFLDVKSRTRVYGYTSYNDDVDFDLLIYNSYNDDVDLDYNNYYDDVNLDYNNLDEDSLGLPNSLQYVYWCGYPFTCLPKNFDAKNLVGLKMRLSNIHQLWEAGERKDLKKLKFIDLTKCELRSLDVRMIRNLKWLKLILCENLIEIHMPVECPNLKHLHLQCSKLKTLKLTRAINLEELDLIECKDLEELQMPIEKFNLKSCSIKNSKLRTLNLTWAENLEKLNVKVCEDLEELLVPVRTLSLKHLHLQCSKLKTLKLTRAINLEELDLIECKDLEELQMPIEKFNLKFFSIKNSKLRTLNLTLAENLEKLNVKVCEDLEELLLPVGTSNLKHLNLQCSKLKTLNLTWALNIKELDLIQCKDLEELQMPIEKFNLKCFSIKNSKMRTLNLTWAENLEKLNVEVCENLEELLIPDRTSNLKHLHLECSKLKTLNLTWVENLKTLKVKCEDMEELHMTAKSLNLKHFHLQSSKLKTLNLTWALNLEELHLFDCKDLEQLQMPLEKFNLKSLYIINYKLRTLNVKLAENLEKLKAQSPNLKHLCLECCMIKTLNLNWALNFEELDLIECKDLEELQMPTKKFNLKSFSIKNSKLRTLNLTGAENLEKLNVVQCKDLEELHMPNESLELNSILMNRCPKVRILELGQSPNLWQLNLEDCYYVVEIHATVLSLKNLSRKRNFKNINLRGCVRLKHMLVNQWFPEAGLTDLHLTARSLDTCPLHPDNNMPKFVFDNDPLYTFFFGNLEKLVSFGLCACTNLESFAKSICDLQQIRKLTIGGSIPEVPNEIGQLECLEELKLSLKNIKYLPDSICMLKHLKFLLLECCWLLEQLPDHLGRLECLEELYLTECKFLRDIPNKICEMKCLKVLHLQDCILLEKLPKEIGRLKFLKELNIKGTSISHLPASIFELKGLLIFGDKWRLESYGFTSVMENSDNIFYCYI